MQIKAQEKAMGDGFQFIDIILMAMVAGFIALRLRSVLGRRTGHEPDKRSEQLDRVITPHGKEQVAASEPGSDGDLIVRFEANPKLRKAFREMQKLEPHFDLDAFLDGARSVYPLILDAFWRGDRDELRRFLNDDVYADFDAAIKEREEAGHKAEGRVVDLTDLKITDASLTDKTAAITVRFDAEIVSITKDEDDTILEGTMSDTVSVHDLWTFERVLGQDDPNWRLVATESE